MLIAGEFSCGAPPTPDLARFCTGDSRLIGPNSPLPHGLVHLSGGSNGRNEKQFDLAWRLGYIAAVNGNLNLLLSSALLLSRAAVGL